MRQRPSGHHPAQERGSATVEFALVLPLVFVVTLGLVEVGLLARDRALVDAAARAGARAAALQPEDAPARDAAVAAAPGLDPSALAVAVTRAVGTGAPVTVSVAYDDPVRVPFVGWLVGPSVHIESSAVMRQEYG
jgi:Flp pilus assembly protein TadG